ncbi:MAG: PD-(D/E)XK nuclease family protein [Chthoniobacterales bacterium]
MRPWFEAVLPATWKEPLPSLVVVPTRGHALGLKARLLRDGRSHLGLRFVTPTALREIFAAALGQQLPWREHLRLLLAVSAEEILRKAGNLSGERDLNVDDLAAKAVFRAPDHLLRTLDRLETAGWDFEDLQLPSFQPLVRRFREHLDACDFDLVARIDRNAAAQTNGHLPLFSNLLITGFDAAHWPYWFLLRAAVSAARAATVVLEYPHGDLSNADACWIGSWEEMLGEAVPVFDAPHDSIATDSLFSEAEMRAARLPAPARHFVVGADTTEQANAVGLLCLRFLAEKSCTRLAVVVPSAGSLSRLIEVALTKLEIPHNDGFGHPVPGLFESAEWRAWLQLQHGPRVNSLLQLLNALPHREEIFPSLSLTRLERTIRSALAEILIDDLDLLLQFCAADSDGRKQEVATTLRSVLFLPARATMPGFLEATRHAFTDLGWVQHGAELLQHAGAWTTAVGVDFSRTLFLRWLEEISSSFGAARAPLGDHPYARVQLLTIAQAQGQEWSHVIFAGLNEGSWPPAEAGEFARDQEIETFNRGIQKLNRRAAREGRQGEGHTSVRDNHSLYLGPAERRQIALRQFQSLVDSATDGVALGASLVQESAPERLWNPSELFTRLYQQTHRQPLTQSAMGSLQRVTKGWLKEARSLANKSEQLSVSVGQTRLAYDERRCPSAAAGEYDFAFRSEPSSIPILSVSEFEKLLSSPALVWMKKYLGVAAADESADLWATSTGKWIHDWLARIAGGTEKTFARLPAASEIDRRICAAAEQKQAEVTRLCQAAGKPLPDWWISGWRNALFLARSLGEKLATAEGWPWMAAEWKIDQDLPVEVADDVTLSYRGRIDLLLARHETAAGLLEADELWIIDYKTGAKKALKPPLRKKLLDGSALQLGLYAFAARALGADRTWISLLSPLVRPIEPQFSGADIAAEVDIFAELSRMQQTGIFGMHGPLRSAYRFAEDYPLATLVIDPDILEQRWELTHPALVRDEEDIFW